MLSALEVPLMRRAAVTSSVFSLCLSLGLGLLAGCPDRGISQVNPAQGRVENKDIPVQVNRDVDILFLIDDSPSMADKQANLAKNFPKFTTVLSTITGGLPNVHIAVATSDLGTRGAGDPGNPAPGIGTLGSGGCAGSGKNGAFELNGAPVTGANFISDIADANGVRQPNYTGALEDAFSKMAIGAGAGGCGFEQHLEAVKVALQNAQLPSDPNSGFLRDDAFLAVVIIADEDDCSVLDAKDLLASNQNGPAGPLQSFRCTQFGVICDDGGNTTATMKSVGIKGRCHPNDQSTLLTKVGDYVTFLKALKKDPNKVIVAGIVGPPTPFATELRPPTQGATPIPALAHSCTYNASPTDVEVADPAVRLKFFLDQFPNRSTFVPICQADLSGGLIQIGELLKAVIGDPCIEGALADADPNTPGVQPDCSVSQVQNINTDTQTEKLLPNCGTQTITTDTPPCWHLIPDATNCKDTPTQLSLKVENQDKLSNDTHVVANCVTDVTNQ
jgi:hypothetical protein